MSSADVTLHALANPGSGGGGGWMSSASAARHLRKCVRTKCHYTFGDVTGNR